MLHKVDYNSQRNNVTFGSFSGHRQCFTTCAWELLSYYIDIIDGTNDKNLALYFDDVEATVGKPGVAERAMRRWNWIKGNTSYWYLVHQMGLNEWMGRYKVNGHAMYADSMPMDKLIDLVLQRPVIVGTRGLGGLLGGHILLLVGYDGENFICHDSYGDATKWYREHNGEYVKYHQTYLGKHLDGGRALFWSENKI